MKKFSKRLAIMLVLIMMSVTIAACSSGSTGVVGKYYRKGKTIDYIDLKADKKFELRQDDMMYTGDYKIDGKVLTITFSKGGTDTGTINGDTIVDSENIEWVKK